MNTWSLSFTRMSEIVGSREQRLQRAQAEDLIQQIGLDLLLFVEAERHLLVADDLVDHAGDGLPRLAGVDARQLLQIQLGDQGPMYVRFELFKIQLFHAYTIPTIAKRPVLLSEQAEPLLLFSARRTNRMRFWPSAGSPGKWANLPARAASPCSAPCGPPDNRWESSTWLAW